MIDQPLDTAVVGVEDRSQGQRRRSGPQWQALVAEQESGDLSVKGFCEARGLAVSSFHAWRRRFKQRAAQSEASGFVELRAGQGESCDGSEDHDGRLEVRLGPATLLAPLSFLPQVVAALMREADGRC